MTRKALLTVILAVVMTLHAMSQTGTITGTAFDEAAGVPLGFVSVSLYSMKDSSLVNGQLSDADGLFRFEGLKRGTYMVRLQFLGYEPAASSSIVIGDGQQHVALGRIGLLANQQLLNEVQVTGQQLQQVNKIDKQVYKAEQFQAAKGGTAIDVIRNMPSVSVDGQGQITLRGAQGFLVLINGKPVQADAATMLSQIPANQVEDIELITSPSAKYDPDGRGGIINIITKAGADDGFALVANVQGGLPSIEDYGNMERQQRHGADMTINYRRGAWDLTASANYLRNDNAGLRDGDVYTITGNRRTAFPSLGERSFDKYNYGGRFNVGFKPDERNQFSIGFFAGHKFQDRIADIHYDNTTTDINTGAVIGRSRYFNANLQNKQGDFVLGNLDYTHAFADGASLSFTVLYERADLYGSTLNRNIEGVDTIQNTVSTYTNPLNGFRGKVDFSTPLGQGKWESGYQYRRDDQDGNFVYRVREMNNADFAVVPEFTGKVKAVNQIHSVYTQYSGNSARLEYMGGLRYEYADRDLNVQSVDVSEHKLTLHNLFPSANALYTFNDRWKARAGISRRVQRTNNFELNPIPEREHSETLEQGDANLLPEFIYLAELGAIRNFKQGSWFTTVYFQDIKNPIQRVNNVFADTILNRVYTNAERATRLGIELGANYSPVKWAQLYLGTNVYKSRTSGVILDYADRLENAAWVYTINANANVQLTRRFSIQGNVNFLSDRPTVQGEDSRFLSPNLSLKHTFMDGALTALVQWQNIGMGLLSSNEQRITTWAPDFYTTTNYIYEVDVVMVNLSFNLNRLTRDFKLPRSEFGEKEF
ncbi:Outer membrane receptor proteins, mostly Fe transport [Parapedobacter composti]|uniref:Outer membrane receptor proteins, mostly Fe transport n=1 Tax=Parapedobacter composti TaxID=623281 RepID=A0A1I1GFP2_9SPHI|nr:TonB-dependent receptor [Parapedobacter composti]SFC08153.1 Outer membrane receptor proteins, mostly Fe transport [Parapedobacter composti]